MLCFQFLKPVPNAESIAIALLSIAVLMGMSGLLIHDVFHIDLIGIEVIHGAPPREHLDPIGSSETVVTKLKWATLRFDDTLADAYKLGMITLTNRRLIVKRVVSAPGLCFVSVPLGQIADVQFRAKGLLRPEKMRIVFESEAPIESVEVFSNDVHRLYKALVGIMQLDKPVGPNSPHRKANPK